jgi:ferric-dicitrate binding protein FerR (iron transport regulator)
MDKIREDIESLLIRCCEEKASDDEIQYVLNWMKESPENVRIAKDVQMLYLAADTSNVMKKVDIEKALSQVQQRIHPRHRLTWWQWSQRIAVILVLPLIALLAIQYLRIKEVPIQMLEARTNPSMTTSIILPDSTVVYLNSESSLRYPSSFDGADVRNVTLSGEGFFKVKNENGRHFIVNTGRGTSVEVLGTSFNVEAYQKNTNISTTLIEGKVYFNYSIDGINKCILMNPKEKVVFNTSNGNINKFSTEGVSEISWKENKIIFDNTPFSDVIRMLEKRYYVSFIIQNKQFLNGAFTGTFTNQRLDRILEFFKISSNIKWKYIDDSDINQEKSKIILY